MKIFTIWVLCAPGCIRNLKYFIYSRTENIPNFINDLQFLNFRNNGTLNPQSKSSTRCLLLIIVQKYDKKIL